MVEYNPPRVVLDEIGGISFNSNLFVSTTKVEDTVNNINNFVGSSDDSINENTLSGKVNYILSVLSDLVTPLPTIDPSNYVLKSFLTSTLLNYSTIIYNDSRYSYKTDLSNYVSNNAFINSISDFVTIADTDLKYPLKATLNNYVLTTALTSALDNYFTKINADSRYALADSLVNHLSTINTDSRSALSVNFNAYLNVLNSLPYVYMPLNSGSAIEAIYASGSNPVSVVNQNVVFTANAEGVRGGRNCAFFNAVDSCFAITATNTSMFMIGTEDLFTMQFYMYGLLKTGSRSNFVSLGESTSGMLFRLYDNFMWNASANKSFTLTINTWHFISIIKNLTNRTLQMYADGVLIAELAYNAALNTQLFKLVIGARLSIDNLSFVEYFSGYISQFLYMKGVSSIEPLYNKIRT